MKTAAQATANYSANGSAPTSANLWAQNFTTNIPGILDAAIRAIPRWQAAVSTQLAASNMTNGLNKAKGKTAAIATKVNGVGKASFSAGVRAAGSPGGNYDAFSQQWMTAVQQERQSLDTTNPRGDRAANRQRQAAYDAWVDSQAGKFRVK